MSRALFIADLHLAGERADGCEQFLRFLREEAARTQALYVLGDLFESWPGDDALSAGGDPLGAEVAAGLRALAENGVRVRLMHGNRDFLLGGAFLEASGALLIEDPSVIEFAGRRLVLLHGDTLCTDDRDYQDWRRTARSAEWQRDFLSKSLSERQKTIHDLRDRSNEAVAAKSAAIMDVNADAVRETFRRLGLRHMIHGHTHRPARHEIEVDGARCERWVLPDWHAHGGYLALDEFGPRLVSF